MKDSKQTLTPMLITCLGVSLSALSPWATAATGDDQLTSPGQTSLQNAVKSAVSTNPQVNAALNAFNASGEDRRQAFGSYLPSVDVRAGVGQQARSLDSEGSYDTHYYEVAVSQMLYDGFATSEDVERLSKVRLQRYYELRSAAESVAQEATQAYLDVLRYRRLVALAEANYEEHQRVYQQVEDRARSGAGRRVDLVQISGRLALAESNVITERSNLHDVSVRYQRIVGELPPEQLAAMPSIDTDFPNDIKAAVNTAYVSNPDLHAALANIEAVKAERAGRKSTYQPRLDLQLNAGRYENDSGSFDPQGERDRYGVSLVASMNIYNGGSDQASIRSGTYRLAQSRDDRDRACRDVRQTTRIAWNDVRNLQEQLRFLSEHRQSSDRVRTAYRQQFRIGERTLLDMLDTENEYFEASRAYVNAEYDIKAAKARTLASMGMLTQALHVMRDDVPSLDQGSGLSASELCRVDMPDPMPVAKVSAAPARSQPMAATETPVVAEPEPAPVAATQKPAPQAAAVEPSNDMRADVPTASLSGDVFAMNGAFLIAEARRQLDQIIAQQHQRGLPLKKVVVSGYTDSTGDANFNRYLSEKRARNVADYLIREGGIPASRVEAAGYGARDPLASNATAQGRSKNRRVELRFQYAQ